METSSSTPSIRSGWVNVRGWKFRLGGCGGHTFDGWKVFFNTGLLKYVFFRALKHFIPELYIDRKH